MSWLSFYDEKQRICRAINRYELFRAGALLETEFQEFVLRLYEPEEFRALLEMAGFKSIRLFKPYRSYEPDGRIMNNQRNGQADLCSTRRKFLGAGVGSIALAAGGKLTAAAASAEQPSNSDAPPIWGSVKALTFDVFGTVVDWRSSIIREGHSLTKTKGLRVDWLKFADAWRAGYRPAMNRVQKRELPWINLDGLHRLILEDLLQQFGIKGLSEEEIDHLNRAWHRLMPWTDSVPGLNRLRSRYVLATLSNGNMSLLVNMAKNAGLPWDCVLSAELAGHYKPDPEVY